MNKTFMDYSACMQNDDNIDDTLSISWFKSWLGGLDIISNKESKIKKTGNYEIHQQGRNQNKLQKIMVRW